MPLGKNSLPLTGAVFVLAAQPVDSPQENSFTYGEVVSGATIFTYVGGNPLSRVDPRGLDPWWNDPSLKRVPNDNQQVIDWLCKNGGAGSPIVELMDARNKGFDRYDDNLPAAERFAEMLDGNYSHYSPWRSDDFNFGQFLNKTRKDLFGGGKGNGSKDANFVAKWGAQGAFNFEQGMSWQDWKQRNCSCERK